MEYQIQDRSRYCVRTGRELRPGERFFSVLFDREGAWVREDISTEAWDGPPVDAFSFWMSRVPPPEHTRRLQVDEQLLIDCLARLADETDPAKVNFRYVLALLLMRRKRLRFEETAHELGNELLVLRCTRTRTAYRVVNPHLTEQQIADVQAEVQNVLGLG